MNDDRTLFKRVDYDLTTLLTYLDIGDIGLPDIQRPFVWSSAKVRDLFDSMYRGFPVGYLLFWANTNGEGARQIGETDKAHKVPSLLIVDGQQRLTALYSVFRGVPVVDNNYQTKRIEIAFRPRDGKFDVADAAIRKDPEFLPDISSIWTSGKSSRKLVNDFLNSLQAKREVSEEEEEVISHSLDRLFDLQRYPFTALEIVPTIDEEQVADIFVRINSEGVKLNQADFILTLLSVFWEEGRAALEEFCRLCRKVPNKVVPSPYNHFIEAAPDQLLRVSVAVGFYRGRLRSVYQILRGKDLSTGKFSAEMREQQFAILKDNQHKVLNLTWWHGFLNALVGAGFRSGKLISSQNTLIYSYAFYLIGKTCYRVPDHILDRLIARWFYAASMSGRYTGPFETTVESDLGMVRDLPNADAFVATLDKIIDDALTNDFWNITLPNELDTSSARSPALFAFYAAQNKLKAPVLFSSKAIADLLDPAIATKKKALDRHHLFPKAWLSKQDVTDVKVVNQTANFALLEWPDNIHISDAPPSVYLPEMRQRYQDQAKWDEMCRLHALPHGWENMEYMEFLEARRGLMAHIIKEGFETLR